MHKELRISNYSENSYLYYKVTSILENIINTSKDSDVVKKASNYLIKLNSIGNPFNFDKTIRSESDLVCLLDIVAEVESYLESL